MADAGALDGPDEFERRYMDADRALVRVRRRQPRWARVAMLAVVVWWVAQLVPVLMLLWRLMHLPGALWTALGYALYLLACTALMVTGFLGGLAARVVLSPSHLRVQQALLLIEIPVSSVRAVSVERVGWRAPGSLWGNLRLREQSYGFPWEKQALKVAWVDDKGRDRVTWVRTDAAESFRRELSALLAGGEVTGLRVATDDVDVANEESEVEREPEPAKRAKG